MDAKTYKNVKVELKIKINNKEELEHAITFRPDNFLEYSNKSIMDFGRKIFPAVRKCIYCSTTDDLRREHIIPFGLCPGGEGNAAVLSQATCGTCAKITSAFERDVLRGPLWAVWILRKLKSRRKHELAPTTEKLTILRNGVRESIEISLHRYPILFTFPHLSVPRYLTRQNGTGVEVNGFVTISFGPSPEAILREFGGQEIELRPEVYQPVAFARMIAKIGYAFAYSEGVLDLLRAPSPVLPSIMGYVDDIGQWVGTLTDPIKKYPGLLHRLTIRQDNENQLLIADVQLFADSGTPTYGVILGPLRGAGSR